MNPRTLLYGAHVIETELQSSGKYTLEINGEATGRRFRTREEAEQAGMDEIDRELERNRGPKR
jgi:hypothetical protein